MSVMDEHGARDRERFIRGLRARLSTADLVEWARRQDLEADFQALHRHLTQARAVAWSSDREAIDALLAASKRRQTENTERIKELETAPKGEAEA